MSDVVRCRGMTTEGKPCERPTTHYTGFCPQHQKDHESLDILNILRCSECSFGECSVRNKGIDGLCWWELYDDTSELDTFDKLRQMLRETLKAQRTLHRRLVRTVARRHASIIDSEGKFSGELIREIRLLEDSFISNLKTYSEICGWKVIKSEATEKAKFKHLAQVFENEMEKVPIATAESTKAVADVLNNSGLILRGDRKMTSEELRKEKALSAQHRDIDFSELEEPTIIDAEDEFLDGEDSDSDDDDEEDDKKEGDSQ